MSPKHPTPDDLSLWQLVTRDVKRLFGAENTEQPASAKKPPRPPKQETASHLPPVEPSFGLKAQPTPAPQVSAGLDRRTEDKFRKGKMEIEARLDLHGLTLKEAQPAVSSFIRMSHAAGKRCVLIITGKGQPDAQPKAWYESSKGQIRSNLKHWLDAPELKNLVLSVSTAQPQHGGSGAFYILLRRQR